MSRWRVPPHAQETSSSPLKASTKLKDEIEHLPSDKRREVAERIKEAREFGDISENSEYDDAKNEQAMLEAQIAQLEEKLRAATVIDPEELSHRHRRASARSSTSRTRRPASRSKYTIVGSAEANPAENKLSNESPVGQGAARPQAQRDRLGAGAARARRKLKITKIDVGV